MKSRRNCSANNTASNGGCLAGVGGEEVVGSWCTVGEGA